MTMNLNTIDSDLSNNLHATAPTLVQHAKDEAKHIADPSQAGYSVRRHSAGIMVAFTLLSVSLFRWT
ncbi:MAG: hypothetical protein NVSMB62_25470 [Acidobacteriaceae bacterium]